MKFSKPKLLKKSSINTYPISSNQLSEWSSSKATISVLKKLSNSKTTKWNTICRWCKI